MNKDELIEKAVSCGGYIDALYEVRIAKEAARLAYEDAAEIADEYPKRDPAEDGSGYWAAEEIATAIRAKAAALKGDSRD